MLPAELAKQIRLLEIRTTRIVDEITDPWGLKVELVEMKDVEIPESMQRAMALITEETSKINATGNELKEVTPRLMASIDEISNEIDQFKV